MQKPNFWTLLFVLICLCGSFTMQANQPGIWGKIQLSQKWQPMVYLSYIPNLNERFTVSSAMIIDEAPINDSGEFLFSTEFLPEEEGLYRIHVSKKGYPRATLTIGGNEQNFQFLIAHKDGQVLIHNVDSAAPFQSVVFHDSINQQIVWVNNWANFADSAHFAGTSLKKELIATAIHEKMRLFADTCKNPLLALYALYNSNFKSNAQANDDFYNRFLLKWKNEDSDYFKTFSSSFKKEAPVSKYNYVWVGLVCFSLGGFTVFVLISKSGSKNLEQNLSIQERKILKLLKEGKSNKEISEEYNIGVNTVKSHVSSIYSKLKVKSRRDLLDPVG